MRRNTFKTDDLISSWITFICEESIPVFFYFIFFFFFFFGGGEGGGGLETNEILETCSMKGRHLCTVAVI